MVQKNEKQPANKRTRRIGTTKIRQCYQESIIKIFTGNVCTDVPSFELKIYKITWPNKKEQRKRGEKKLHL